jgi:hypothetical protein
LVSSASVTARFVAVKLSPASAKDENLMFDEHATVRTKNAIHLDLWFFCKNPLMVAGGPIVTAQVLSGLHHRYVRI